MKIELRNVKHAAFASEETECFNATIYIDSMKVGDARNDGKGGSTLIFPRTTRDRIDAYAKTLPKVVVKWDDPDIKGDDLEYQPDAESVIDKLLADYLVERDLKRILAKKTAFFHKGKVWTVNGRFSELTLAYVQKRYPDAPVLNTLPLPEAVALYRAAA